MSKEIKTIVIPRHNQKWLQYKMTDETWNLLDSTIVGGAMRFGWGTRLDQLIELLPGVLKKTITKSEIEPLKNGATIKYMYIDEAQPDERSKG